MRKKNASRGEKVGPSVEVLYEKVQEGPVRQHSAIFFQLTYIMSGTGKVDVNDNMMPYHTGNLLLMTPNDRHRFDVMTPSEFLLIRFDSRHVKEYRWKSIDHIECLLHYATQLSGCIMRSKKDGVLVKKIVRSLLHVLDQKDVYNEDLTMHLVNTLIVIAARNIAKIRPADIREGADKKVLDIISYIQTHIYSPPKLKVEVIAREFGISKNYLGSYFKSQCGESLLHYIAGYKIRLIEHRLKFSDRRVHEIVDEFDFADESHLNKFFKKHRGVSLTAYRKAER